MNKIIVFDVDRTIVASYTSELYSLQKAIEIVTGNKLSADSLSETATMTTIGQKDVITGKIYVPPITLQKAFSDFGDQIDKSKLAIRQALVSLEKSRNAIMKEVFG